MNKKILIDSLKERLVSELAPQNPVSFLKTIVSSEKMSIETMIDIATAVIFLHSRNKQKKPALMVEVICAIGHTIRNKTKQKRNSALAARTGAFILYTFEKCGIGHVLLSSGNGGHGTYIFTVLKEDVLEMLYNSIVFNVTEKLPSTEPYAPWETAYHVTGIPLVKTESPEVLNALLPETHPIIFNVLNRKMKTGWQINFNVYELSVWALRNKTQAFNDIWSQHNAEARATKQREAQTIGSIAKRFLHKTFYHLYTTDFRGRIYANTAFLHEQGSDYAKGLLLREDRKPIGKNGFFWLCVSIANNWAGDCGRDDGLKSDKIPLKDRFEWVLDNEEIILSYAANPKVNQGWMTADKPWQFIAACIELFKLRTWQLNLKDVDIDNFNYESQLEVFVDG
jgi:hypothetical protein